MCSVLLSTVGDLLFTTLQVVICGGIMLFLILSFLGIMKYNNDYGRSVKRRREAEERMNRFWDDLENGGSIEIHLEPRDDDDDDNSHRKS